MRDQTTTLPPADDYETPQRGSLDSEYQIYLANAKDLGWEIKSYDDWLNS